MTGWRAVTNACHCDERGSDWRYLMVESSEEAICSWRAVERRMGCVRDMWDSVLPYNDFFIAASQARWLRKLAMTGWLAVTNVCYCQGDSKPKAGTTSLPSW